MPDDGSRLYRGRRLRRLILTGVATMSLVMGMMALPAAMADSDGAGPAAMEASTPTEELDKSGSTEDPSAGESDPPEMIAIDDASLEHEPKLFVEGTLMVYAVDPGPRLSVRGAEAPGPHSAESGRIYRLVTESGESLEIVGDLPSWVRSGSDFRGTLALPDAVVDAVDPGRVTLVERAADDPVRMQTDEGTQVVEAVRAHEAPLEIAAAEIRAATHAALATKKHTIDIAVVSPRGTGTGTFISRAQVDEIVAKVSAFWKIESRGALPSITVRDFKAYASAKSVAEGGCHAFTLWDEALVKFDTTLSDYGMETDSTHLAVLSPAECGAGTGLASVGAGLHDGGVIWAGLGGHTDLLTVGHEFGHNTSLDHSNVHWCSGAEVIEGKFTASTDSYSDNCWDSEYEDYFDFMAGGMSLEANGAVTANNTLTAVNAPDRERLGLYKPGELKSVTQAAGVATSIASYTINAASASGGVRGLKVKDPGNHETYFLEFRSGSDVDKDAFYTQPGIEWAQGYGTIDGLGLGVRVLKKRPDNTTAALRAVDTDGRGWRNIFLAPGKSLTSRGGGLTVTLSAMDLAANTATVAVKLTGAGQTKVDRIFGADRYSTAVEISKAGFPGVAPVVYLATGSNYPDALAAAPAAVRMGGPLLLTTSASLPASVRAEITRLKPQKVIVVGGKGAVSDAVVIGLKKMLPQAVVKRIGGVDRFDTSRRLIADAFQATDIAYVSTGMDYPDALSASAAAGAIGAPVLLVNGKATSLDKATAALLKKLAVKKVLVAGGSGVLSTGIEKGLKKYSPTRFAGKDRFETSQKINRHAFPKATQTFLATGFQFPDALAGAALAGAKKSPLYVVQPTCIPAGILKDIRSSGAVRVTLLGGTGALSKQVAALKSCG